MKRIHLFLLAAGCLFCSCADDLLKSYEVGKPDNLAEYAYLTDYAPLKEYVDHAKYPNFKLGVAVSANDYVKKQLTYALVNSNFEEVVAGNEMKMASCVSDDGTMVFGPVTDFVEMAEAAGIPVYGHTLAWHSQQPVKWLNSLIAPKPVPVDPNAPKESTWVEQVTNGDCEGTDFTCLVGKDGDTGASNVVEGQGVDGSRCIKVHSIDNPNQNWDTQFFVYTPNHTWNAGDKYRFKMQYRADKVAGTETQCQNGIGQYMHWTMLPNLSEFPTEWKEYSVEGTIPAEGNGMHTIAFNLNVLKEATDYYFDNISWEAWVEVAGPVKYWESLVNNGDLEGDDVSNYFTTEPSTGGPHPSTIQDGVGVDGSRGIVVQSADNPTQDWDTQFFIRVPEKLTEGTKIHVAFDYRASGDGACDTQSQKEPGQYIHWECIGSPNFTTAWQHWDTEVVVNGTMAGGGEFQSIAFNLAKNKVTTTFYFDNIVFEVEKENVGGIPQTPEEMKENLVPAMEAWIQGMMEGCKGKVHAFDVVNEAISGGDPDSEGVYALQHANPEDPDDAKNNFFWQDYLGDLDYVRLAVKFARLYGPSDVKLFINDYNLESWWDNNGKLKSLIKWIERWEADGETKIDGIGTQMHISYYLNPNSQAAIEKSIEEMFKLMVATGKLVRVSELDMGINDENGNAINTADVTEEQHHKMAEFYKWIIGKYLEIVPVDQQSGICQWCVTDSPANSGWRANQPVGLWDLNYNRKHTYAGFADGLQK